MYTDIFQLLRDLKLNHTNDLMNEIIHYFEDGFDIYSILEDQDTSRYLLNGHHKDFYHKLSEFFIDDLNNCPEMYFVLWETLIYFFNGKSKSILFKFSLELSKNTDAEDFVNGIIELEHNSYPEIALFYFNRIEHYVSSYFSGCCYLELKNYENAIRKFELFLNQFTEKLDDLATEEFDLSKDSGFLVVMWNVYNDLGYLYNRVGDYRKALESYQKSLEIINLDECYKIKSIKYDFQELDDFTIFINNYLWALEKTGKYSNAIDILQFLVEKNPNNSYYKNKIGKFKDKLANQKISNEIINEIFNRKSPFKIGQYEKNKLISKEKSLEGLIIEQIKAGFPVFGRIMEIYEDKNIFGRQYYISSVNGFLDLLLIDKSDNSLYVVELKRNMAGIEVIEQIEKYMYGISIELNRATKGIICLHKPDEKLKESIKNKQHIELYSYNFGFEKI